MIIKHSDHLYRWFLGEVAVGSNGHTLYLYSGCDNTEIVLIGENETEVYSAYVLEGTTQVQLPSVLQGTYELHILRGQYMFYTEIEL